MIREFRIRCCSRVHCVLFPARSSPSITISAPRGDRNSEADIFVELLWRLRRRGSEVGEDAGEGEGVLRARAWAVDMALRVRSHASLPTIPLAVA